MVQLEAIMWSKSLPYGPIVLKHLIFGSFQHLGKTIIGDQFLCMVWNPSTCPRFVSNYVVVVLPLFALGQD